MEITASTSTDTRDAAVRVHTAASACSLLGAWTGPLTLWTNSQGDTQLSTPKTTSVEGGGATLRNDAIGLPGVLFQSITAMAPAAAVATALSPAIPFAGASLPLAVLLATIACAFIASSIGQLAIHIPSAGGMYTYISRSLGAR
jgi:hypothetical protein